MFDARAVSTDGDDRADAVTVLGLDLPAIAEEIVEHLRAHGFPAEDAVNRQVLTLAEEVGEFVGAYRRWSGQARRTGTAEEMHAELADVVITAYVTAHEFGINLDAVIAAKLAVIFTRGWRTPDHPDTTGCACHEPPILDESGPTGDTVPPPRRLSTIRRGRARDAARGTP